MHATIHHAIVLSEQPEQSHPLLYSAAPRQLLHQPGLHVDVQLLQASEPADGPSRQRMARPVRAVGWVSWDRGSRRSTLSGGWQQEKHQCRTQRGPWLALVLALLRAVRGIMASCCTYTKMSAASLVMVQAARTQQGMHM